MTAAIIAGKGSPPLFLVSVIPVGTVVPVEDDVSVAEVLAAVVEVVLLAAVEVVFVVDTEVIVTAAAVVTADLSEEGASELLTCSDSAAPSCAAVCSEL